MFLASAEGNLRSIVFWAFGSFERAGWSVLPYPAAALAISLFSMDAAASAFWPYYRVHFPRWSVSGWEKYPLSSSLRSIIRLRSSADGSRSLSWQNMCSWC